MMARHALSQPIVVDVTADDTVAALRLALTAGMDVVMANKRPLAGPLSDARGLLDLAAPVCCPPAPRDDRGRRLTHHRHLSQTRGCWG